MTTNGAAGRGATIADMPVSTTLLVAEKTGQIPAEGWPQLRELLLASTDPQLTAVVEPLRQLLQARQAVVAARQELDRGYATVAASIDNAVQLAEAASNLSMLADELSARAGALAGLTG